MGASANKVQIGEVFGAIVEPEKGRLGKDGRDRKPRAPLRLILLSKVRGVKVKADLEVIAQVR
jgi:hypothetical protein